MATGTPTGTTIQRPGRKRWPLILATVIIIAAIVSVVAYEYFTVTTSVTIQGAGATFPSKLIQNWSATYHNLYSNVTINYNPVGSTSGYKLIANKTVDFGASDAPLTDAQIVAAPGLILFPETLGGVAVTYNVPGVSANTHLNFTGLVLVEIYNGTITNWNDARIQSINSIPLPSTPITTVHRSDGSGTTYAFQNYLAAVNTWWNATYHYGTAVNWPVTPLTAAGSGNQQVTGAVSNTPGAIGYVDVIFAIQQSLGVGAIQNRVGNFIQP